ncbi:MAG TPA: lipase maturation factor family protein [Thermoanaerobaculia bacterium]|nr:lipase maturation factor family protein [Thermoanaerobaculia bacterium]
MSQAPPTTYFVRGLLLRLLAAVYLIAFASFWVQAEGLIGPRGLLPANAFLEAIGERLGSEAYWRAPTLLWLAPGSALLHLICAAGVAISLLAIAGFWPLGCYAALWALYLSIVVGGQDFMSFQWDVLLLESGLVALFLAPARRRAGLTERTPPPGVGIWLMRFLVWKLMFLSGATKLLAFDPTWWKLTALEYHYYTQPLPWWTSWFAHQLPPWIGAACVAIVILIEIGAPWLIVVGARARILAFGLLVGLQLAIAWTGNYGFFNLLTIVLSTALLDDRQIERVLPLLRERRLGAPSSRALERAMRRGGWPGTLRGVLAAALAALSLLVTVRELARTARPRATGTLAAAVEWSERRLLEPALPALEAIAPLRSINGYGLFRSMTTLRPEIVLEASADGTSWSEIELRFKPGDVHRRPRLAAPHHPRLDWQMWFAALAPREAAWLRTLLRRVLEGEHAVLDLIGTREWRDRPPRYVRLRYYRYEFTSWGERRETGAWWRREAIGDLTERMSLQELDRIERSSR